MILLNRRMGYGQDSTLGVYNLVTVDGALGNVLAYSLEDEGRNRKVWGETRIPAARYPLKLRTNVAPPGSQPTFHQRYLDRFGDRHHGMIEIVGVTTHTDCLIHIGNDDDDTGGCQLTGTTPRMTIVNGWPEFVVERSTEAYWRVYEAVVPTLRAGGLVWLEIVDWTGVVDVADYPGV